MARIAVFGAGIFGLSVAWVLARRGASIDVIEPLAPGAGASGGIVGALAPHVPENWNEKKAFQFESLKRAEVFWRDVAEVSGQSSGYARLGRVQPLAEKDIPLAERRAETAKVFWQGRYNWQILEAQGFGGLVPPGTERVIFDDLSARIHPRCAVLALIEALQRLGARVLDEPSGHYDAEVFATGASGLEALSRELGQEVGSGQKGQAALLKCDLRTLPQVFVDAIHIIPQEDGTVAVGSTSERDFANANDTDELLDALIAKVRALCPVLADAPVVERWAGLRPRSRSRAPMIGQHPNRQGTFIANGGFKIGFGMAPKIAEVLSDMILDGQDAIPESFRVAASLR